MTVSPPIALLAELTYRCPLRCGYCSNPSDWGRYTRELDGATWARVLREASEMGVLQLHLSGGEPLLRDDLEDIVRAGRDAGLYVNLITSAWGVTRERLAALRDAGVDHVQVSLQDTDALMADRIAGTSAHAHKLEAARWVRELGMALSINVVLHRANIEHTADIIALSESLGAVRLELASAQYHGSALAHRDALLPTRAQVDAARAIGVAEAARLRGTMDVIYVIPDYYEDWPRPCTDGWGRRFLTVIPDGTVLPCAGAHDLPGMRFDNVREKPLADIWYRGEDFARFRGTDWMPEPCQSCDRREMDFGGCRCQAFALTGDARNTDPTCRKSPHHALITDARRDARDVPAVLYRIDTSRRRSAS